MKYRKKPVIIDAVKWCGDNVKEVMNFMVWRNASHDDRTGLLIHTLEGTLHASIGDMIIKGVQGEFYACKPDIFAATYEDAENSPPLPQQGGEQTAATMRHQALLGGYAQGSNAECHFNNGFQKAAEIYAAVLPQGEEQTDEVTEEMIEAGQAAIRDDGWHDDHAGEMDLRSVYLAMRDAAVLPQVGEATRKIAEYDVNGSWYECHTIDEMQQFYLSRLPAIREAAKACGYAIGLHGSGRRDFDLMAMQWIDDCATPDELAHAIAKAACGIVREGPYQWEKKPQGRIATSFTICWTDHSDAFPKGMLSLGHIDLSIIAPAGLGEASMNQELIDRITIALQAPFPREEINLNDVVALLKIAGQASPQATVEPLTDEQILHLVRYSTCGSAAIPDAEWCSFARALFASLPTSKAPTGEDRIALIKAVRDEMIDLARAYGVMNFVQYARDWITVEAIDAAIATMQGEKA